jgi:D-serine dehydratase
MPVSLKETLRTREPLMWLNPRLRAAASVLPGLPIGAGEIEQAHNVFHRWRTVLSRLFAELARSGGQIDSPFVYLEAAAAVLGSAPAGQVWIKQDSELTVVGSIKARGGIFEVLSYAEQVMHECGIPFADPQAPLSAQAQQAFSSRTVTVASTGNLALSIGTMAAALGFRTVVHMAGIAKEWKKQRLRSFGVEVREHEGDFTSAVTAGREEALAKGYYFVDDERSTKLLLGYAVAGRHLASQLAEQHIEVDADHPLFVYLPCGVGGSPGGITLGLKHLFGDNVHCLFAEPCASPAMLARLAYPDASMSVYDLGLDNLTEADGLAVGHGSSLVTSLVGELVSGIFTVRDEELVRYLYRLHQATGTVVEPSAAAGFSGPGMLLDTAQGQEYLRAHALHPRMAAATHVLWTTGGSLLPGQERAQLLARGRRLCESRPA